jgi:hypothetical protein
MGSLTESVTKILSRLSGAAARDAAGAAARDAVGAAERDAARAAGRQAATPAASAATRAAEDAGREAGGALPPGKAGVFERMLGSVRAAPRRALGAIKRGLRDLAWSAPEALGDFAFSKGGLLGGAAAWGVGSAAKIAGGFMVADAALLVGRDKLARAVFGDQAVDIQNMASYGTASVYDHALKIGAAGAAAYSLGSFVKSSRGRSLGSLAGGAVLSRGLKGGFAAAEAAARNPRGATVAALVGMLGVAEAGNLGGVVAGAARDFGLGASPTATAAAPSMGGLAASSSASGPVGVDHEASRPGRDGATGPTLAAASPPTRGALSPVRGPAVDAFLGAASASTSGPQAAAAPVSPGGVVAIPDDRFAAAGPLRAVDAGASMKIGAIDSRAQAGNLALDVGRRDAAWEAARPVAYVEGSRPDGTAYFLMGRREPGADPASMSATFAAQVGPGGAGLSASRVIPIAGGFVDRTVRSDDASLVRESAARAAFSPQGGPVLLLTQAGRVAAPALGRGAATPDQVSEAIGAGGLTGVAASVTQSYAVGSSPPSLRAVFAGDGRDGVRTAASVELAPGRGTLSVLGADGKPAWSMALDPAEVSVSPNGMPWLTGAARADMRAFVSDPAAFRARNLARGATVDPGGPDPAAGPASSSLQLPAGSTGATLGVGAVRSPAGPAASQDVRPAPFAPDPSSVGEASSGRSHVVVARLSGAQFAGFSGADPRVAAAVGALAPAPGVRVVAGEGLVADGSTYFGVTSVAPNGSAAGFSVAASSAGASMLATSEVVSNNGRIQRSVSASGPELAAVAAGPSEHGGPTTRVVPSPAGVARAAELGEASRRSDPLLSSLLSGGMTGVSGTYAQMTGTDVSATLSFSGRGASGAQVAGAVHMSNGRGDVVLYGPDGRTPVWSKEMDGSGIHLDRMGNVFLSGKDADIARSFVSDPEAFRDSGLRVGVPRAAVGSVGPMTAGAVPAGVSAASGVPGGVSPVADSSPPAASPSGGLPLLRADAGDAPRRFAPEAPGSLTGGIVSDAARAPRRPEGSQFMDFFAAGGAGSLQEVMKADPAAALARRLPVAAPLLDPRANAALGEITAASQPVPANVARTAAQMESRFTGTAVALGLLDPGAPDMSRPIVMSGGIAADGARYGSVGRYDGRGNGVFSQVTTATDGPSGQAVAASLTGVESGVRFERTASSAGPGLVYRTGLDRTEVFPSVQGNVRLDGMRAALAVPDDRIAALGSGSLSTVEARVVQAGGDQARNALRFSGTGPDGTRSVGGVDTADGIGRMSLYGEAGRTTWSMPIGGRAPDGSAEVRVDTAGNVKFSGRSAANLDNFLKDPAAFRAAHPEFDVAPAGVQAPGGAPQLARPSLLPALDAWSRLGESRHEQVPAAETPVRSALVRSVGAGGVGVS